ncbi:MAG: hypothetical protein QM760_13425 [Nibricoccus sp.]
MALGKFQLQIVNKLVEMERLTEDQRDTIAGMEEELNGDQLDKLLQDEYKISSFQMLTAKGRAFGLAPFNVSRFRTNASTFERIPQDFCQEHLVIPVGLVGDFILIAFANPFEVSLPAKIQEMTGMKVIRMLGREKDIKEKFTVTTQAAGFGDIAEKLGAEFGGKDVDLEITDEGAEESGPIIQLSTRIIEDAFYAGTSDIHIEPGEKEIDRPLPH